MNEVIILCKLTSLEAGSVKDFLDKKLERKAYDHESIADRSRRDGFAKLRLALMKSLTE